MPKWIIDISVWQSFTPPTIQIFKQHGLAGGIIRCAQGANIIDTKLASNVKLFQDAGIPYGVYQWVDITQDPVKQSDLGLALCNKYNANFLAGDFEQYWLDWNEYWNYNYNHIGSISIAPSKKIYDVYASYTSLVLQKLSKPFVAYSAPWFINGYCNQLPNLLKTLPYYWNAYYPTYKDPDGDNFLSWEEFEEYFNHLPKEISIPNVNTSIWQFNYMTIENSFSIDQNIVYDDIVFDKLFGESNVDPIPTPEPSIPIVLQIARVTATAGLRVRDLPSLTGNRLYVLPYNTVVNIYEIKDGWARIDAFGQKWVSMDWLK